MFKLRQGQILMQDWLSDHSLTTEKKQTWTNMNLNARINL